MQDSHYFQEGEVTSLSKSSQGEVTSLSKSSQGEVTFLSESSQGEVEVNREKWGDFWGKVKGN